MWLASGQQDVAAISEILTGRFPILCLIVPVDYKCVCPVYRSTSAVCVLWLENRIWISPALPVATLLIIARRSLEISLAVTEPTLSCSVAGILITGRKIVFSIIANVAQETL